MFRSRQNVAYLAGLFADRVPPGPMRLFALETLEDSVHSYERGEDLIYSDPLAQRLSSRPAATLWGEVRRLNLAFYEYRMQFIRDKASLITGHSSDGQWDDDEQYHFRMFTADSLHPPGLESLNGNGPLFGIREDQTIANEPGFSAGSRSGGPPLAASRRGPRREGFSSTGARTSPDSSTLPMDPGVSSDDWAWDDGNPNRTSEEAIAEYWGEDRVETSVLGSKEVGGEAYIDRYGQGPQWRENGGSRFMRYEEIPRWQHTAGALDGIDRDIDETLGTGSRELDNHVRRWNTDRMTDSRGEEYRRYGPRNGSTV
jgi:hypothetical protein